MANKVHVLDVLPGYEDDDVRTGDLLHPGILDPASPWDVAKLTGTQREERVLRLIDQANLILDTAASMADEKPITATALLFSGGNDSTVLAHVTRPRITHAIHANTGIGVEDTREFVRDICTRWSVPLLERTPPAGDTYREHVLKHGFPGPGMHGRMYQRLKERTLDWASHELMENPWKERVIFVAGRRRAESDRRSGIPLLERRGPRIWASPLAMWTKADMTAYRLMKGDVPLNRVSVLLGMSGECLCGSFAHPNEKEELREHFPRTAAEIDALEAEVRAAGFTWPLDTWGHGQKVGKGRTAKGGPLCSSCSTDPLLAKIDPLAS